MRPTESGLQAHPPNLLLRLFQQSADPVWTAQPLAVSISDDFQRNLVALGELREDGAQASEKAGPTARGASLIWRAVRPAAVCALQYLLLDSANHHGVARQSFL